VVSALLETIVLKVQPMNLNVLQVLTVLQVLQLNVMLAPLDPTAKNQVLHRLLLVILTIGALKEPFTRDNALLVILVPFLSVHMPVPILQHVKSALLVDSAGLTMPCPQLTMVVELIPFLQVPICA
jgi:hypothetical protein